MNMKKVYLINAHEYYPVSEGKLNSSLVEKAKSLLSAKGYAVQSITMKEEYNINTEIEKHVWGRLRHPAVTRKLDGRSLEL